MTLWQLRETSDIEASASAWRCSSARDHIDLHRGLIGGGAVALGIIRQILSGVVRDELAATGGKKSADAIPRELVVQYIVGAYMAVLIWWLDRGAKLPPAQVDAMFRRLAIDGILPDLTEGCPPQSPLRLNETTRK
jgi:hypothetical protein